MDQFTLQIERHHISLLIHYCYNEEPGHDL
jgi:hypothetical protein